MKFTIYMLIGLLMLASCSEQPGQAKKDAKDPLPSWNDGDSKQQILQFVTAVTIPESEDYIPENDRIAVFDNDGTLWSEKPLYFQFLFVIDRIREMADDHPEWISMQPFQAVLENDMETLMSSGVEGLLTLTMATHSGMTTEQFDEVVRNWIATARHPKTGKRYVEMVYQPMLELLDYLRANNFKTYIVSGGGVDFLRVWSEEVYGIPPQQVIGSSGKVHYALLNEKPVLMKRPEVDFINDKEEKPVGIHKHIGKKPVAAFGNSDGDLAMLQWTSSGNGRRLMAYIHHTDETREWAYDRESHIGKLNKGLDEALEKGWLVVDMKTDWKRIYPFDSQ